MIMADGSLKHPLGQFNGPLPRLGGQGGGEGSGMCLVGFSKSSSLILSEGAVAALSKSRTAAYHKVDSGESDRVSISRRVQTVLAKFSADGLVFRVDIAAQNDDESLARVLGTILWNDAFSSGYPDSLKVAHHLSVFSKADDQALKAFVTRRFKLRQLPTFSLRRIALGSFKGGA